MVKNCHLGDLNRKASKATRYHQTLAVSVNNAED